MELLENLELVEVVFEDKKVTLTFFDEENGYIREVFWNKQVFDSESSKWVDNEEKAAKVDEWCKQYFDLEFEQLAQAIGERKDVYAYDNFNSLWQVNVIKKFDLDLEGTIFETEIKEIEDDGKAVRIKFEYEGDTYESKLQYADYLEVKKQWLVNPVKRNKQYEAFKNKYGVSIEDKDELLGKNIMVEVKVAFGKFPYADIKPLVRKKKK